MVEFEAFSPGVVKLFGEHAVVYGHPAVAVAIDRGVRVVCREGSGLRVRTVSTISGSVEWIGDKAVVESQFFAYIEAAYRLARERWGVSGINAEVVSELPPSIGAATSAATVGAFLKCAAGLAGAELSAEELAEMIYSVEKLVQGAASRMDGSVTAMGGVLLVRGSERVRLNVEIPELLVVLTPRRGTTRSLVAMVRELRERMPEVVDSVFATISSIVNRGVRCLESGDYRCVGELMTMNHWLLASLGLSNAQVDSLVRALSGAVYGAKMSGAGGGGVVVALPYTDSARAIAEGFGYEAVRARVWNGTRRGD